MTNLELKEIGMSAQSNPDTAPTTGTSEGQMYKCWYYDVASESGTCDTPRNMPYDELPERIQRIKDKCRINRY